ncbi:amidohydrolase family protein [Brevibacterium oceani]|uniref:amidohydrolase family protein n=1 Tax=Brevibacterium oceani TaxID=358099 RepID=UPI001B338AAA|nr:amidohydrolase family protein [Brevibacterium oceani]
MTVLHNVRILDLKSSASAGELVDIEFSDTITAIRPSAEPDPSSAATVLPGLIDTHVHLKSRNALLAAVRSGLTTVIDLGTHPDSVVDGYRADAEVPAILSAGSAASAPGSTQIAVMGFPSESGVTGPEDAERFLDWRVANGVDLIKIIIEDPDATETPALDIPTLQAIVGGARKRGLLTVAHAVTAASFDRGLDAGVDVLTHIPFDRPLSKATFSRIVESGTLVSPTLVMVRAITDARLGEHADAAMELAIGNVSALLDGGATVIAGTDANETPFAPVPHGPSLHSELGYLVQAGMTGAEAIRAATSAAADAFGLSDRGRIVEGARADLIVVDGDPLTELSVLSSPAEVVVGGRRLV